jgi:hypothetical protein
MEGTLNSFSKDKNQGSFHTLDGRHIPYRFIGRERSELLKAFSHQGTVRAKAKVSFDSSLNPTRLEIHTIRVGQQSLFSQRKDVKRQLKNRQSRSLSQSS